LIGGSAQAKDEASELRERMSRLMKRLMRERVYHRALTPIEKGIVYIACKPGFKLISPLLRRTLDAIFEKASEWLRPSFVSRAMLVGRERAEANVRAALLMGCPSAKKWLDDRAYVLLLGINAMSASPFAISRASSR